MRNLKCNVKNYGRVLSTGFPCVIFWLDQRIQFLCFWIVRSSRAMTIFLRLYTLRSLPQSYSFLNSRKGGFTLLEVLIVLLLVTIIIGISGVFLANTLPSNRINAVARDISTAFRQARTFAQMNGKIQTVTINLDLKDFGIDGHKSSTISPDIMLKIVDARLGEINTGKYTFAFYPHGLSEGGTIVLYSEKKSLKIEMDPVMGAVITK